MDLAALISKYRGSLEAQFSLQILPGHRRAMDAITQCRTPAAGELLACCTDCGQIEWHPRSCGHRNCPKCQNHDATGWLERQKDKLLPVPYFLVTFTLPAELRPLAWNHQRKVYDAMFAAARQTLVAFGRDPKYLGADIGFTGILQTHSRRKIYHPHLHCVVPGGGIDQATMQWKKTRGNYLFHQESLAKVFRGKLFHELEERELEIPRGVPEKWVVDCRDVGRGSQALEYLSRYLYRGVISEADILSDQDGQVTFRYTDWQSKATRTETLPGAQFLWRILQHVLPRGFHRIRNYGLLHHSARVKLQLLQLMLGVRIDPTPPAPRPTYTCSHCGGPMKALGEFRCNPGIRIRPPCPRQPEGIAC